MYKFLCGYVFSFLLDISGHIVTLCLIAWGTARLFPKQLYHFIFPPAVCEDVDFSTSSQIIVTIWFFNSGHPSGCEIVSHCGFDLHFPDDEWCPAPFHMFVSHLYISSGKMSILILCPLFVFLLLSCESSLYILDKSS